MPTRRRDQAVADHSGSHGAATVCERRGATLWTLIHLKFLPLNDFYGYIGSARQELERCRRPALHWYESGLVEW
jgi:hypothetical protein